MTDSKVTSEDPREFFQRDGRMFDMLEARSVELTVSPDGRVWFNVNGICLFRCRNSELVVLEKDAKSTILFKKGG